MWGGEREAIEIPILPKNSVKHEENCVIDINIISQWSAIYC